MNPFYFESADYQKSPFFVRISEKNYNRMKKFFSDEDICFIVNESIDNSIQDFISLISYVSEDCIKNMESSVDENGMIEL